MLKERASPVLKVRSPEELDGPPPVLTAMFPPLDEPVSDVVEPEVMSILPPLPEELAPLDREMMPAALLTEDPTAITTSPPEPDADEPLRKKTDPVAPFDDEVPLPRMRSPVSPALEGPDWTETPPLGPF